MNFFSKKKKRLSVSHTTNFVNRGGGGLPYKKRRGCSSEILKKNLKSTKILFCGRGLKWSPPLRGTNSKTIRYLLSYLFRFNHYTLKGTVKSPPRLNTLRGTKTAFLTLKRYDEHPPSFLYVSLSPPLPGGV